MSSDVVDGFCVTMNYMNIKSMLILSMEADVGSILRVDFDTSDTNAQRQQVKH